MFEELFLEETEEIKNDENLNKHINVLISKARNGKVTKADIRNFNMHTKEQKVQSPREIGGAVVKLITSIISLIIVKSTGKISITLLVGAAMALVLRIADNNYTKEAIEVNKKCIAEIKKALEKPNLTEEQRKQLEKLLKKFEKATKRIKVFGVRSETRLGVTYSENNDLSDELYLECQDILLEDETDPEVIEFVLTEGIKDLFKRKKKKAEETEDAQTAEEELNEGIKSLLINVVDYSEVNGLCEDVNALLMESIICQDEEVFNEGIKDLFKKRKKAKDEEEFEEKEETISEEIDTEELADDEDIEAVSESAKFEEFDPIVLTEDEVRLVPRGEKYLISESDFESVCFNYLGEKDGYQVLEAIAEAHDIESEDIIVMMSEGEIVNPKVKVNKGVNRKK